MNTPDCQSRTAPDGAVGTMPQTTRRAVARALGLGMLAALLLGTASQSSAQVQITGNLANFDVRYPGSLPNDLDIFLYGDGLTVADVLSTFNNPHWGTANSVTASVNNDPNSPGFGLDCIHVRWVGPATPALVGLMRHFGVRLRPGAAVAHQEVWWTINGIPIERPCDPHITWICTRTSWLICITNPTPLPIYIYGCRWFPIAPAAPLPLLAQMNTNINPLAFGATGWTPVPPPGPAGQAFCIQPWCRIYIRIPVTTWRPIIFQIAARNIPGPVPPQPDPNDWDGNNGTMAILTTRPTLEMREDIDGNSGVGTSDFNMLRARFGQVSPDISGN